MPRPHRTLTTTPGWSVEAGACAGAARPAPRSLGVTSVPVRAPQGERSRGSGAGRREPPRRLPRSAAGRGAGGEGLDVVGPLEGGRVGDRSLAQLAAELADRLVAVPVHPVPHLGPERAQMIGAVA